MCRTNRTHSLALIMGLCALLTGCLSHSDRPSADSETVEANVQLSPSSLTPRNIESIADEYLNAMMQRYPTTATYLGILEDAHDKLFDNSLEALSKWQKQEDRWLAELDEIGTPPLVGSRDWVTFGILSEQLASVQATRICRKELWETSTTTAWYTGLPFVFDKQPLESDRHRRHALQRLTDLERFIDTEIANLRRGLALGYSSPRLTVLAVPDEVRALNKNDSPFLNMGRRAQNYEFQQAVETLVQQTVVPAIERYARFIEDEYLPQARDEIALSQNPNGAQCYPALIRSFATVQPSADEIHKLGLEQMAKIRKEMNVVLEKHYDGESIESFVRRVNADAEFTFRSEADVLKYSVDSLDAAKQAMSKAFGLLPKADVVIKPYPSFAASGVGEYQSSSEDGSKPGIFYIAVRDPTSRSKATQQSTLYHETYPGHHLQGAIALELGDRVHALARYLWNSGYGEGWALYSERLAQELGLYTSPLDLMGLYSDQAARAARLVIDSGIHTRGWTRQQSVDYMMNNTSWAEVDINNDVNRYISWPGQANSYMLGMLEIRRLRSLAESQLGAKFDLREFHDRILENGSVTLPMLEHAVVHWIDAKKN